MHRHILFGDGNSDLVVIHVTLSLGVKTDSLIDFE